MTEPAETARHRVLIADDSKGVAEIFAMWARAAGRDVTTVTADFGELLKPEPWADIDVAVVDFVLPRTDGHQILAYLALDFPQIRRILCSAVAVPAGGARNLAHVWLPKPCNEAEFIEALG